MNDWTRFRLARATKWFVLFAVLMVVVGAFTGLSPILAVFQLPALIWGVLPFVAQLGVRVLLRDPPVRRAVLVPVPRRHRHLLPGRHQDPVHRRMGPGPCGSPGQGEHRLPGEAARDREQGRLCPQWTPALGSARHRQDADGGGGRRRDGQAVRVRGPGRLQRHVHGCGHPQGEGSVPEAAQARTALRRRDRLLRRGGCARQPRSARPWRHLPASHARGLRQPFLPRHELPVRGQPMAAGSGRHGAEPGRNRFDGHSAGLLHGRHGRWRRHGYVAGAAHRAVRTQEAARLHQPVRPPRPGHATEAATEVPHPRHDGDQPPAGAGRGAAAPGPHRPHVPGGLPVQAGPDPYVRGLSQQGEA